MSTLAAPALRRAAAVLGATIALAACAACVGTGGQGAPDERPAGVPTPVAPTTREIVLDQGSARVVDLRPVRVQARPGDVVVIRSGNPGRPDDESPLHHLFTSATGPDRPPLFVPVGGGHLPNPGVWGVCLGGAPAAATGGCPVPPADGPDGYDGTSYASLGALLPGESRTLRLSPEVPMGSYRLESAIYRDLEILVEVVPEPVAPAIPPPIDTAAALEEARRAVRGRSSAQAWRGRPGDREIVVLGARLEAPPAEVLVAMPSTVRVPAGGSVTWVVGGDSPHTVELEPGGSRGHVPALTHTTARDTTPRLPPGGRWSGVTEVRSGILSRDPSIGRTTFTLVFTRPGTYLARDRFHPGVRTVVTVG